MEFDQNLMYNFASLIASALFVIATGITIFRRLKLRWPVNVNCWFCNNDTKIYHSELKWWRCPSCEQYNGFTKDGDYAYDIPEQSKQVPKIFAKPCTKEENARNEAGNLCERCNHNEELKILELRTFEPKGLFNRGLNKFKQSLEAKYPLCDDCKILVQNVLRKQSLWLTRYKMLVFKQKSVRAIINNVKKMDTTVRIILTLLGASMICYPSYRLLPFAGAFFQSSVFAINSAYKNSDALLTLLWLCIIFIEPLNKINLFELYRTEEWPCLENITEHHFVIVLTVIIGLTNVTSRYRNTSSFKASFKKLESPSGRKKLSSFFDDSFENFGSKENISKLQNYSNFQSSVNNSEIMISQESMHETRKFEDAPIASPRQFNKEPIRDYPNSGGRHFLKFDDNSEQYSLNDSLSTLKTLTLGDTRSGNQTRIPSIFKSRIYGSTSPDLFQRTSGKVSRKIILAPPKLKSFAQTSWVAGGYWQVDVAPPSLSRSSSQSSGFGSAGSNFGPSREPSISKEIEQCSVISDNTPFSHPPRPSSVNSVNSCCQHATNLHSSQFENCNKSFRIVPNASYSQSSHFTPAHTENGGCYEHFLSLQNSIINSSPIQQSQIPNIPTFCNSHVWLPILLCGSLVFNIAVFCTIILR